MGEISFARIDERLIHGQVMTSIAQSSGANSIYIVDNPSAKDDFLKTIYAVSGKRVRLKTKTYSIDEITEEWNKNQFGKDKVLLLTKDIDHMAAIIDNGILVNAVNVGGIAKKSGTTSIIPAVGIDQEMADELKRVNEEHEVEVYFQQVPTTEKVTLASALRKFK